MTYSNTSSTSTQLFTDLTAEEGAAISGGFEYIIANRTDVRVPITFNGEQRAIAPLTDLVIQSNLNQAVVAYDGIIGPGFDLNAEVLSPGLSGFDRNGNELLLVKAGEGVPVPLFAPGTSIR